MANGAALNAFVFLFAFASMFLLNSKRPLLRMSTRVMLVAVFGLALVYVADPQPWLRPIAAVATGISTALFVAFAALDVRAWQAERAARR